MGAFPIGCLLFGQPLFVYAVPDAHRNSPSVNMTGLSVMNNCSFLFKENYVSLNGPLLSSTSDTIGNQILFIR